MSFKVRLNELECTFYYSSAGFCNVFILVRAVRFSSEEKTSSLQPIGLVSCCLCWEFDPRWAL